MSIKLTRLAVFVIGTSLIATCLQSLCNADPPPRIEQPQTRSQKLEKNALDVIESTRGGRHWIDGDAARPMSPDESLAAMQIERGYEVRLFAAEPLVMDPVAITFDRRGRMFAAEYGDYPVGPEDGGDPLSRIVLLEDVDGDKVADKRTVFADKLDFAHSMMAYRDGLLVGAKTQILFLKDTDGDQVADVRQVLFDGFHPAHPQMQIGNPCWGIDNWIYFNYGPGEVSSMKEPDNIVKLPRKEFRFHPGTLDFEADSGLGQFGNTIDRWGNRFYCTNRNPIITTFLAPSTIDRNPFHVVRKASYDVGKSGGETQVFPLVNMKSNYLSHAGTHTSACGTTAYTGEFGDSDFRDSVMVCEPIGHLVTRSIVRPDGVKLRAERSQPNADFIASTDTWFRPSNLANGPDGALYLADMYRLWVEHPKFLPPEIAEKLDWRAGEDRGRIYRIVPMSNSTGQHEPFVEPETMEDLVALLSHPNGWRQFLGQRVIVERQMTDAVPLVRRLLRDAPLPTTRLHALWTLDGLSALSAEDVILAIGDRHPRVRSASLQVGHKFLNAPQVFRAASATVDDVDIRVRFQFGLALSAVDSPAATRLLAELAVRDGSDPWFADGLLTSLRDRSGALLGRLISETGFLAAGDDGKIDLVTQLASIIGARGERDSLAQLFRWLGDEQIPGDWWRAAALSGLGQGLPRHRGDLGRTTLTKLLADPPELLSGSSNRLSQFFNRMRQLALDTDGSIIQRTAAIEVLAYQPLDQLAGAFKELLSAHQPAPIQSAAVDALAVVRSPEASAILLDRWPNLGPSVRGAALELLLSRPDSIGLTLAAMRDGRVQSSSLSIDQRVRLLKHGDASIRDQSVELFGGAVSANRVQVSKQYEPSISMAATAAKGEAVFTRVCANCHRYNGKGHTVGPDLSDVRNRPKAAILYEILDPNSKVEPRFTAYSVLTIDGTVYTGLIESESADAVVLTMAEGKKQTIGRAEIEQMKVSNVSMMPEGIEKDITLKEMADLLEFLSP